MTTTSHKKSNRLIHSTSPYLLQHAYNPVDWFEWNTEALEKAKREDKPMLVSIGYSSCHWCHVMERECFEQEDLASLMNDYFVCIKVDREERPDIDQVYMEAVQAMGINGGWPLNVFLTSDQKPFYGGTYFPPKVWAQVLTNIHQAYQERRSEITDSAEELTKILSSTDSNRFRSSGKENIEFQQSLQTIYNNLERNFDYSWGGLEKAPKFIMPSIWLWLLRFHHLTSNPKALQHLILTLDKIAQGGIYDQVGGGFARYSVDGEWFVPHFEKMLYDNAQLLSLYSEAYTLTKKPQFKRIIAQTISWLEREMMHPDGGFYSALDADSEGVEGKFYCWTKTELENALSDDAQLFCTYYGVTEEGNWEHGQNILKRIFPEQEFLNQHSLTDAAWQEKLKHGHQILLRIREQRVRPGLDDKILTGWNAMTIVGLVDAYLALQDESILVLAIKNMTFLETNLTDGTKCFRTFRNERSVTEGFLEDYACLIHAYLKLYEADFNEEWITKATALTEYVLEHFYDPMDKLFFFTSSRAEKLIARRKELFDNVIPASNSIMAQNILRLGTLLDNTEWKELAHSMMGSFTELITKEPNYMSNWAIAFTAWQSNPAEVAIVGNQTLQAHRALREHYLPLTLFMGTAGKSNLPLLRDKAITPDQTTYYVCRNFTCKQPVQKVNEALEQILNKS
ncbi:MAG: thioredoxin domain-containing protein [Cyclobacteriaceae bacterium]|nr:thioredoxin domain-containing protein [Cyclobacteriaceae bacterium]